MVIKLRAIWLYASQKSSKGTNLLHFYNVDTFHCQTIGCNLQNVATCLDVKVCEEQKLNSRYDLRNKKEKETMLLCPMPPVIECKFVHPHLMRVNKTWLWLVERVCGPSQSDVIITKKWWGPPQNDFMLIKKWCDSVDPTPFPPIRVNVHPH